MSWIYSTTCLRSSSSASPISSRPDRPYWPILNTAARNTRSMDFCLRPTWRSGRSYPTRPAVLKRRWARVPDEASLQQCLEASLGPSHQPDKGGAMSAIVQMLKLNKSYGTFHVLKNIDLQVQSGEVVVIIGASGSGKSTLIRCVNGLEQFGEGRLVVDGFELAPSEDGFGIAKKELAAVRREVGMVFQHFNLFPHKTVLENVMLAPIPVRKWPRARAEATARKLLERVGLRDHVDKYPSQISGGQQQRVAI